MNCLKKSLLATTAMSTMALLASPASAEVLVAGWDTFSSSITPTATQMDADTTASLTSSATTGNWGQWNGTGTNDAGASTDGTFGNLSTSVATASTFGAGAGTNSGSNLSLNRSAKPGTLTISLVNNSAVDRDLLGFYFDGAARFAQAANTWELTFSGAISGTAAGGTLASGSIKDVGAARDWGIDLSGLSDNVWEAGSTATFSLTFTGGDPSQGTGGGQETLIDNIGITATAVPEPGSLALLGLGGLLIARRRRD